MKVRKVAVIGMGTMGAQIGIVCARGGFDTAMVEVSSERAENGMHAIESFLRKQTRKGKIDDETGARIRKQISTGTDMQAAVSDADLVIEAVFEDMEQKKILTVPRVRSGYHLKITEQY